MIAMKLSLVVPCYNEAENVAAFQDAVLNAFDGCGFDYEIIFIDDGALAAVGKHEQLYASCDAYRKMVDLQRLEEEGGEHNA